MGPPNFSYTAQDGSSGTLKDFRGQKNVLLVLFSWPESRERLAQLRELYPGLAQPIRCCWRCRRMIPDSQELAADQAQVPFPVVTQGRTRSCEAISCFAGRLNKPDLLGEGTLPPHMEFLVDRFGYLRARWIPDADGPGWSNTDMLMQQVAQLNREKEILPPPGDHVH